MAKASKNRNAGPIDFSLFTDGLRAEREQGITIDVAYRYFATARRKFILADGPFTIENEQLTPSLKIRRHVLKQVYGERLDALY